MIGYVYGSRSAQLELAGLKGKSSQQTEQAEATLLAITKEVEEKEAKRNAQAVLQEEQDNAAKNEIIRLTHELANRPVRVRIITESGACSSSSSGAAATNGQDSDRYATESSVLLPESNSKRLRAALADVETLSAAYNSCRARAFMALE